MDGSHTQYKVITIIGKKISNIPVLTSSPPKWKSSNGKIFLISVNCIVHRKSSYKQNSIKTDLVNYMEIHH